MDFHKSMWCVFKHKINQTKPNNDLKAHYTGIPFLLNSDP